MPPNLNEWSLWRSELSGFERRGCAQTGSSSHVRGAGKCQMPVASANLRASSTSTPRYLTVLSIFVCPRSGRHADFR